MTTIIVHADETIRQALIRSKIGPSEVTVVVLDKGVHRWPLDGLDLLTKAEIRGVGEDFLLEPHGPLLAPVPGPRRWKAILALCAVARARW